MSALPPPPLQGWQGIPPVWRHWFQNLFGRVGGTTGRLVVIEDDGSDASALDELEARVRAAIPERQDVAALEARIADLEARVAAVPERADLPALEARIADLEAQQAGIAEPSMADILRRLEALEAP